MPQRSTEVCPPPKNFYNAGRPGFVEKAATLADPQPPSEQQIYALKVTILYYNSKKNVRIPAPSQDIWHNAQLAQAWRNKYPLPTWSHLYRWMEQVGEQHLEQLGVELGLPKEPRIAPPPQKH